jgi:hypothetical protein
VVSSGGVFRRVADAITAILVVKGFFPVKNWVKNFVFPFHPEMIHPFFPIPSPISTIWPVV